MWHKMKEEKKTTLKNTIKTYIKSTDWTLQQYQWSIYEKPQKQQQESEKKTQFCCFHILVHLPSNECFAFKVPCERSD